MKPTSREVIRVREDLAVEVKCDRLVVRRGQAVVEVFPGEIRHLVNALAEAGRLVNMCRSPGSAHKVDVRCQELPTRVHLRFSHGFEAWLTASP